MRVNPLLRGITIAKFEGISARIFAAIGSEACRYLLMTHPGLASVSDSEIIALRDLKFHVPEIFPL
jgi:hypothetical protein